jgi:DNA mismatch repair ATPase MutS
VKLGAKLPLLVVSGSNMSGKSTLLRSVGVNAVLALAGAPVRATRLTLSRLQVAASIRVEDSLQEGISHFYAEILRLRQIMELTRSETPVLFLLDEILQGTNSHDRRIGAEAVVRGLLDRGAIGLITTHDLALSRLAETLNGRAANVHFEDHLEDGKVRFDYRMRAGVVTKSNALELMRGIGLEV